MLAKIEDPNVKGKVIDLNKSMFIKKYKEQLIEQVKLALPDINDFELNELVDEKINTSINLLKYSPSEIDKYDNETKNNMLCIMDYILNENPIVTGFGTLYQQHASGPNILLDMVKMLLDERKVYKKKKLEHANDEDKALFNLFDNYQLTFKLLNNSFFGASGQPNSIFFDPNFPSSILYTGQIIIMTAIVTFEMISGNFYFDRTDDAILFINRALKEEYHHLNKDLFLDIHATKEMVINRIHSKFEGKMYNIKIINDIVDKLNQEELDKVYYKNNLLKFIYNKQIKDILEEIIDLMLSGDSFLDPNKPSSAILDRLTEYWNYVNEVCVYNYIPLNRVNFCHKHKRKTVLVVNL